MSKPTELPIHEVILKIMFKEDKEKPIGLTSGDILWKIDNPEISERYVREVLDWLVREKKVKLYLNKYSLDRYEFLDQKAKNEEDDDELATDTTFYINPPKKKTKAIRNKTILFSGILVLLYITYLFYKMNRDYEVFSKEIVTTSIKNPTLPIKRLYLSEEKENTGENKMDQKFNDISFSFSRQNNNNKNIKKELQRLNKTIDSLQKQHQVKLNKIQKQVAISINNNITFTNALLQKIMIGNFIFILIIVLTFFKKKR